MTPVIPDFILAIPDFILVIPAKAGIHTDSPPEPSCPVPPGLVIPEKAESHCWGWIPAFAGMTTSLTTRSHAGAWEPEFCDSLLRGNDDLRAWEQAVGVLRHPLLPGTEGLKNQRPR
ncbi:MULTISPECIES: hypothetical protein [unclassified Endozoicomonas]|uniref:hypothetical protein n=1 Tax=unclassified Endozoicomonas TaxID=2644528 RepID=UPI003BB737D5